MTRSRHLLLLAFLVIGALAGMGWAVVIYGVVFPDNGMPRR